MDKPDLIQIAQEILKKLESLEQIIINKKKPFLSIDEASEYLGISKNTLYLYTSKKVIPYFKPRDRKIYFKIEDLDRFALSNNDIKDGKYGITG